MSVRTMRMTARLIKTMLCGKRVLTDERGDVLVGFVLIVGLLFGLFFAGVGFFLLFSWLQFTDMATQAGVRTAVVRTPVVAGLPEVIALADEGPVGRSCITNPGACVPLEPRFCGPFYGGGACAGDAFNHIAARMQQIFPVIQPANISIRYEDSGLGYVGGPPVPLVTIVVSDLPIPVIGAIIDLASRLVGGADGAGATLRPIQASMTAEDLNT